MLNVMKLFSRTSKAKQSLVAEARSLSAMNDLTKPEMKRLTSIFNKLDSNKDGYITSTEFGDALKKSFENVSGKLIDDMLSKIPRDPEHKVSLEQFLNSVAPAMVVKNMIEGVVQMTFHIVDVDNDGRISKEEAKEVLKMIGQTADDVKLNSIMSSYDKDKDGSLTLRDLNDYLWMEVVR